MPKDTQVVIRISNKRDKQEITARSIKAEQYLKSLETQKVTKEAFYINQNTGIQL